jgi:hypothetical protein
MVGEVAFAAGSSAIISHPAPPHMRDQYRGFRGTAFSVGLLGPIGGSRLFGVDARLPWVTCALLCVASGVGHSRSRRAYGGEHGKG